MAMVGRTPPHWPLQDLSGGDEIITETYAAREAAAYGELLETLKELVEQEAKGPDVSDQSPEKGNKGQEDASNDVIRVDDGKENGGGRKEAAAAVEAEAERQMMKLSDGSNGAGGVAEQIASLKSMLSQSLGEVTFEKAHARLQTVVDEEEDDVLVADIQRILGASKLDMLPVLLKLIFLEGGGV